MTAARFLPRLFLPAVMAAQAQKATGWDIPGFGSAFQLEDARGPQDLVLQALRSAPPIALQWPGDQPQFVFTPENKSQDTPGLDTQRTIQLSFHVNDNQSPAYELAANRRVLKDNPLAFDNDWATHRANELELGAER